MTQNEINDNVSKILNELIELHKDESKSKKALFDLIQLNSKQIKSQHNLIDVLMTDKYLLTNLKQQEK